MPLIHFYPDPSDPRPVFMFGRFDLDDADPGSPVALGEALLSVRTRTEPDAVPAATLSHRLRGSVASWFRTLRSR